MEQAMNNSSVGEPAEGAAAGDGLPWTKVAVAGLLLTLVFAAMVHGTSMRHVGKLMPGVWMGVLGVARLVFLLRGDPVPGYAREVGVFAPYRRWPYLLRRLGIYAVTLLGGGVALAMHMDASPSSVATFMLAALFLAPAGLPFDICNGWLARRVGDRPTMQQALSLWLPAMMVSFMACVVVMGVIMRIGVLQPMLFFVGAGIGPFVLLWLVSAHRSTLKWHARVEQADHRVDAADTARHLAEARLAVLQAQIEPHFLFNTLATVEYLQQSDPDKAHVLLGQLTRYLRLAMPSMRQLSSTLGREFELTDAYLQIARLRMGGRLEVDVELPDALSAAGFPSLVVQTLVENAIKHGVEPKPGPVRIRVFARRVGDELHVGVQDNGVGLGGATVPGGGTGLQNIRERLRGLHGERARLSVAGLAEGGVLATAVVPLGAEDA